MTWKRRSEDSTKPSPRAASSKPAPSEPLHDREVIDGMVCFGLRPKTRKAA